jgi:hypothetical protein
MVLKTQTEINFWMTAKAHDALRLQCRLSDDASAFVVRDCDWREHGVNW